MDSSLSGGTSATLLARLRLGVPDQTAWAEFVRRYGRLIYQWCRRWRLPEDEAEEVTQAVLVRLVAKLRGFDYDPKRSFRAYLKTLTHYAWCDFLEGRRRPDAGSGDSAVADALAAVEARDDLTDRLQREFDQEVLELATERVRARVEPHTWDAFRLTALEGHSGADAAARLGMKVASLFAAKSKVQKMLREEVRHLQGM
ncbi:MAG TPA: sigma-70 family RNA polymerase sigma factor [Gemmataceae bacterium]|jgi:RNA polymerase sigma-70 factor (ECF subfamily)